MPTSMMTAPGLTMSGAGFDHVGGDELGAADGGDEHVGLTGDLGEVAGAGVADGDGAVGAGFFLEGEQRDGFTDDEGAAEDDHVFALQVGAGAGEEFHDAGGGAGDKAGVVFLGDLADVDRVEAIDVLVRGEAAEGRGFVEVFGQGRLDQNTVDGRVGVEVVDEFFEFSLRGGGWRENDAALDADLGGGLLFFLHIGNGRRVVADAHEGDARLTPGEGGDLGFEFGDDVSRDFVTVDQFHV